MNEEDTLKLKKLFAARLLQIDVDNPQEVFKVALEFAAPNDMGEALRMAKFWPNDPDVLEEKIRLTNEGFTVDEREKLKKELLDTLMKIVRSDRVFTEDRIKAAKEVAAISGITQDNKASQTNVNVNVTSNRVMLVNHHGSDEEWEQGLLQQQEKLVNESTATVN